MATIPAVDRNGLAITIGMAIRIPRGTHIRGPFPGLDKVAGRTYVVTVSSVSPGYEATRTCPAYAPEVRWAGSGSYWLRAAAADIEVL